MAEQPIPANAEGMPKIPDPLLETIREYQKQIDIFAAIPSCEITKENENQLVAQTYGSPFQKLLHDTPETTSLEGVREAMRLCFREDAFECQISENAIKSALAFLETVIGGNATQPTADPLLETINEYLDALADFNANAPLDNEGADAYADISYGPPLARLNQWTEPAKTWAGALKALQIAIEDSGGVYRCEAADRMVKAAIGYLTGLGGTA